MGTCTLLWYPDRGFELDLDLSDGELTLRFAAVPVPADGTVELEGGVALDRLDILFKASVDLQGLPAQLQDARIVLVREGAGAFLQLDARCEDVETGDVVPFQGRVPVELPRAAPAAGGPRPTPANEDDLDWDDETTLEQLVVKGPEAGPGLGRLRREDDPLDGLDGEDGDDAPTRGPASVAGAPKGKPRGLEALLAALESMDDDDDDDDEPGEEEEPVRRPAAKAAPRGAAKAAPAKATPVPVRDGANREDEEDAAGSDRAPGDQHLGARGEARALLDLLVNGDHLEVEDDTDLDELAGGVARILAFPGSAERKAGKLSEWLLQQEGVADLYIGDDDLAEILDKW